LNYLHHSIPSPSLHLQDSNRLKMAEAVGGTLHQWDYLFAFGVIFCALDAYNIGANE